MLRRLGQAAERVALLLAEVAAGVVAVVGVAILVLAVRLAIGPINLNFLLPRIEAALSGGAEAPRLAIGALYLDWPEARHGAEYPLLFTLDRVTLTAGNGAARATIPEAKVALAPLALLSGRIEARRIVLERPRVSAVRPRQGSLALSFGGGAGRADVATTKLAEQALEALAPSAGQPRRSNRFRFLRGLRALEINAAAVTILDQALGTTWVAPNITLALTRAANGELAGQALAVVALDHGRDVRLSALLSLQGERLRIAAHLSPIAAHDLAVAVPGFTPRAVLEAPVSLGVDLTFGRFFALAHASLDARVGSGDLAFNGARIPIEGATLALAVRQDEVTLSSAAFHLAGVNGAPGPTLNATGAARREPHGEWRGRVAIALDRVPLADLARYWPPGIAPGGRAWVTENVTSGTAHDGAITLGFARAPGGPLVLTKVEGGITGNDLVVHWLRPMPPLTNGEARLSIRDPNTLRLRVESAREGKLVVQGGEVVLTGLDRPDQNGAITIRASGPLPDVLALLAEPRLDLLARQKLPLTGASGSVEAGLTVAVPLLKNVSMDAVLVHAEAALRSVALPRILGPYGLDDGTLALSVGNDGLTLSGDASLGGLPAQLSAAMDFRPGGPGEVVERVSARASTNANALARFGLDGLDRFLRGPIALEGDLEWQRNGRARGHVRAGLTDTALRLPVLGLEKPPHEAAHAAATLALSGEKISGIERFTLHGGGIALDGSATFRAGSPERVTIARAVLGRTVGQGSVRFGAGEPMRISLTGSALDLTRYFAPSRKKESPENPAPRGHANGPKWDLDAHFARVFLANGEELRGAAIQATSDGRRVTRAEVRGSFAPDRTFSLALVPSGSGRALRITTADVGKLLAAAGITREIAGGALALSARYEDKEAGAPLAGRAEIDDFTLRNAPLAVHVLEGLSLYGLVPALQGPGLGVSKLVTRFRLMAHVLELSDARAFNPSLGATAKGSIDLAHATAALSGTIIPAYFFNSLLGRIPLIGRIFSPEKGGGLIAATYHIDGPIANPRITVNPLATLTPGFLRGFFSLFGG